MVLVAEVIAAVPVVFSGHRAPRAVSAGPESTAPLVVGDHRTVELVNRGGAAGAALLDRIALEIGPAVDAVQAFWGVDWAHRIVVVAAGSDRQFAAEAGLTGRSSDVAAVAVADRVDPDRRIAVGQRIVFAPGATAMSPDALRIVLGHELFHYATRADTAVDAPRWLTEGVADFVARAPASQAAPAAPPARLPTDADLDTAGPGRAEAYESAWWFARFVAATHGTAALRRLYLAACGPGHLNPPSAVRQTLGADLPDVLARWQRWQRLQN